jgi:hypothetical protein
VKARHTHDRSKEQPSSSIDPSVHPASFALNSLKSRAAARAMLERRPKPRILFGLGDSPRSDAV